MKSTDVPQAVACLPVLQIANLENQATRNARNSASGGEGEGERKAKGWEKISDRQRDESLNKQANAHARIGLIFIVSVVHFLNGNSDKSTFRAIDARSSSFHL